MRSLQSTGARAVRQQQASPQPLCSIHSSSRPNCSTVNVCAVGRSQNHICKAFAPSDLPRTAVAAAAGHRGVTPVGAPAQPCRCYSAAPNAEPVPPLVVVEGDIVTFHMTCTADDGQVLESSRKDGEPLSFEIGAGEITGNPLYQAFDGALRGLGIGEVIELEISGGEWQKELLFTVPRDHPEVERLEGRYKNLGGLQKDLAVELANGTMAVVVEVTPEHVKLDANNMMSGKKLLFELEVLSIDRPAA